jgi:hypothetical protein
VVRLPGPDWYPAFIAYQVALERQTDRDEARFTRVPDTREQAADCWLAVSRTCWPLPTRWTPSSGRRRELLCTSEQDPLDRAANPFVGPISPLIGKRHARQRMVSTISA